MDVHESFVAKDTEFESRVRSSFSQQQLMTLLDASLDRVEPGIVDISLPFRSDLTQQHGYLHASVTTAIADSACGYAALTLTPASCEVLTIEFKMNLLRPAVGKSFIAEGRIVKPGKTVFVTHANVFAFDSSSSRKLIATMTGTIMVMDSA